MDITPGLGHLAGTTSSDQPNPGYLASTPIAYIGQPISQPVPPYGDGFDMPPPCPLPQAENEAIQPAEGFDCPECHRKFVRHCDLNKHLRQHSRPFKCPYQNCKYHEHGWPTEKELQRHNNDIHSSNPKAFVCHFPPCRYTSKRESNLKQHMEKSHDYRYVRSRSTRAYRCPVIGCLECSSQDETRQRHPVDTQPITPATPRHMSYGEFGAYSTTPTMPGPQGEDASQSVWQEPLGNSFVPWTPPPTKSENISRMMRSVDSMIPDHLIPLDPQLVQAQNNYGPQVFTNYGTGASEGLSTHGHQPLNAAPKMSASPSPFALGPPDGVWQATSNYAGQKRRYSAARQSGDFTSAGSRPSMQPSMTPDTVLLKDEYEGGQEESDDDDDGERPPKRQRTVPPGGEWDDASMPCPFRRANPAYFDRNKKEKFSPCHTTHKDFSTIVRHLSRPAHRLAVDERSIHSFEVPQEEEWPILQAGLCRRCWRAFRDRDGFDEHLATQCSKISRGKREKYDLMYNTFCSNFGHDRPEPRSRHTSVAEAEANRRPAAALQPAPVIYGSSVNATADVKPGPAHSEPDDDLPTAPVTSGEAPSESRQDASDVAQRLTVLETEFRMLRREFDIFVSTARQPSNTSIAGLLPAETGSQRGNYALPSQPDSRLRRDVGGETRSCAESDRESLVGGMNSQTVVADKDGLPREAQRSLTGLSSSSDKSSLRHVPLSDEGGPSIGRRETRQSRPKQGAASLDSGYAGSASTKDAMRGHQPQTGTAAEAADLRLPEQQQQPQLGEAALTLGVGGETQPDSSQDYRPVEETPFQEEWEQAFYK